MKKSFMRVLYTETKCHSRSTIRAVYFSAIPRYRITKASVYKHCVLKLIAADERCRIFCIRMRNPSRWLRSPDNRNAFVGIPKCGACVKNMTLEAQICRIRGLTVEILAGGVVW